MGANDHFFDTPDEITTYPNCGKKVIYWTEDQVPGFRDKDYLICPYCKTEIESSMEVEYHIRKEYEEKNRVLFERQKKMLEEFLERGAISQQQYDKSLHDLTEKMKITT